MDMSIILDGWPFDEVEEANNVRKIVGLDGRLKLQIRLRDGAIQWEVDARPDGTRPYGCDSVLDYCLRLARAHAALQSAPRDAGFELPEGLLEELDEELQAYANRRQAFLLISDYEHTLRDARHCLAILDVIGRHVTDSGTVFHYDRRRPQALLDLARAEALLRIQQQQLQSAIQALTRGIDGIEQFHHRHSLSEKITRNRERRLLIDFRRSLRERYNIPLTDPELLQTLQAEQQVAIERENYEMAARLRDKIRLVKGRMDSPG